MSHRFFGSELVSLNVSGRNLILITNYYGYDPEVSNYGQSAITRGIDLAPYPPSRTFYFSIDREALGMMRTYRRTPSATARTQSYGRSALAAVAATLLFAACYNYNLTDPNNQSLSSLTDNPTRASIGAAVTGIFDQQRSDAQSFIWRLGSMGREGINLSGNNQPDYQEPYFGPLSSSEFGASDWDAEYVAIRDANIVIDAVGKAPDMSTPEKALTTAVAQTSKALMFLRLVQTRAQLGAPIECRSPAIRNAGAVRE